MANRTIRTRTTPIPNTLSPRRPKRTRGGMNRMPESGTRRDFYRFDATPFYAERGWLLGGGAVGGKAKGLAFAHRALSAGPLSGSVLLPPVTLVVGSEVFLGFIDDNDMEWAYREPDWERIAIAFSKGRFRESFTRDIERGLALLGGVPLAIRSSSTLEDSVRLSFAGKYDTCFSANIGDPGRQMREIEDSLRTVWASLFKSAPRAYRAKHGCRDDDEAMAVLIQPITGKLRDDLYYPELAGAAFSRVYRRPTPRVRKEDGVMRLCFGLGTRTVERSNARVFYLTNPNVRPERNQPREIARAGQTEFDYIDRTFGSFMTARLDQFLPFVLKRHASVHSFVEIFADNLLYWAGCPLTPASRPVFSFSSLPDKHPHFFRLVRDVLSSLEAAMWMPVDIEFTYDTDDRKMTLIQLRPLASFAEAAGVVPPDVPPERVLLRGDRMVSNGLIGRTEWLVYVDPDLYGTDGRNHEIAREIGRINRSLEGSRYILVGPGRWGSTNADLGVPVQYDELCNSGCIVEIGIRERDFTPELSYGTHFFLDLDVDGILYLPVFAGETGNEYDKSWFDAGPYEKGRHPAVRIYRGAFAVYMDGESEIGRVVRL